MNTDQHRSASCVAVVPFYLCSTVFICGSFFSFLVDAPIAFADGPADNSLDQVRRIPKLGVEVSDADRQELTDGLKSLQKKFDQLRGANTALAKGLLPDVLIFHRAVDQALRFQEFFDPKEVTAARGFSSRAISEPTNCWQAMLRGPRKRGSLSEVTFRRSTRRFSLMGW